MFPVPARPSLNLSGLFQVRGRGEVRRSSQLPAMSDKLRFPASLPGDGQVGPLAGDFTTEEKQWIQLSWPD